MSERLDEFGDGTDVVLVTFTDPTNLVEYSERNDLPFPIVVDGNRTMYRAFGLGRGSLAAIWGLKSLRKYVDILRRKGTGRLEKATEDTRQLGGDFVVGPDGTLVYGFWGSGPADRPDVQELIEAVLEANG